MASSGASSSDSLCGLAFGKKIYFEDGGGGGDSGASGCPKGLVEPQLPPAKKGKTVVLPQPPPAPRCQVEGCMVDLTGAKAYYCRHKVCGMHSKSPMVVVAGMEQRFCQQCSRFHQLSEFDQGKRSCRRRLAGHNERRRKPRQVPLTSHYGHLSSSFQEDSNRFRSFLVDFSYPRPPGVRDMWPTAQASEHVNGHPCYGSCNAPSSGLTAHSCHLYMQGSTGSTYAHNPNIQQPPIESLAGVSDSSCALSLLSTQPWGYSTTSRNQSPNAHSWFGSSPVAQPIITNSCMGHNNLHDMQNEMGLTHLADAACSQFSGELELALQGSRQCQNVCPQRACSHSCHAMHWSL